MTIAELLPGQGGIIESVGGAGETRDRLLDMGLTPGTRITLRKTAPLGDPLQLSLRGYELSIRKADASRISVALCPGGSFCSGGCQAQD
jgi:Fe2+ transport system protein FeoA